MTPRLYMGAETIDSSIGESTVVAIGAASNFSGTTDVRGRKGA